MTKKEHRRKELCALSGIPYHGPIKRKWIIIRQKWADIRFVAIHYVVAYSLWAMVKMVPKRYEHQWFMTFQHWCFNHKRT